VAFIPQLIIISCSTSHNSTDFVVNSGYIQSHILKKERYSSFWKKIKFNCPNFDEESKCKKNIWQNLHSTTQILMRYAWQNRLEKFHHWHVLVSPILQVFFWWSGKVVGISIKNILEKLLIVSLMLGHGIRLGMGGSLDQTLGLTRNLWPRVASPIKNSSATMCL